ncbi:hypothetical protein NIES4075_65150 [Tolypothrix sp. NIES-4075]|nr:hypothetical protein NIES4075_65150 [Tolypothrix sp. NIES-4075]
MVNFGNALQKFLQIGLIKNFTAEVLASDAAVINSIVGNKLLLALMSKQQTHTPFYEVSHDEENTFYCYVYFVKRSNYL